MANKEKRNKLREEEENGKQFFAKALKRSDENNTVTSSLRLYFKNTSEQKANDLLRGEYSDSSPFGIWRGIVLNINKKSPKLLDSHLSVIFELFQNHRQEFIRTLDDWKPQGKGKDTLFISLLSHLFAKYKMPVFFWSIFESFYKENIPGGWYYQQPVPDFSRQTFLAISNFVFYVSKGNSVYKAIQEKIFPIPLTRKQCHMLMNSTSDMTFMNAVRWVQVQTHGGNRRLLNNIMKFHVFKEINSTADEAFWDTVLMFFARNPMLDPAHFGPMIDYISNKRLNNADFSMKGRTALALLEDVRAWHENLNKIKMLKSEEYTSCGLSDKSYEIKENDYWTMTEILSSKELHKEGQHMKHCVISYGGSIASGYCSIWSLKHNGERAITVEVRKNQIVQARGVCNRQPNNDEYKILLRWANESGVSLGRYF